MIEVDEKKRAIIQDDGQVVIYNDNAKNRCSRANKSY